MVLRCYLRRMLEYGGWCRGCDDDDGCVRILNDILMVYLVAYSMSWTRSVCLFARFCTFDVNDDA